MNPEDVLFEHGDFHHLNLDERRNLGLTWALKLAWLDYVQQKLFETKRKRRTSVPIGNQCCSETHPRVDVSQLLIFSMVAAMQNK